MADEKRAGLVELLMTHREDGYVDLGSYCRQGCEDYQCGWLPSTESAQAEEYAAHLVDVIAAHLEAVAGEAWESVARAVRDETRVGPLGPNALEILNSGGVTSLTPTEAEAAAKAAMTAYLTAALDGMRNA